MRQLFLSTIALLTSAVSVPAIEGLKLRVEGSNAVVSWPSQQSETYIVQYRATLLTNTPWVTLTNNLPAALNTNQTTFTHMNSVLYPGCSGTGGGSGGPPPAPGGSSIASSAEELDVATPWWEKWIYEGRAPYVYEIEKRPPYPWDPDVWAMRVDRQSLSVDGSTTQSSLQSECQPTIGFYQVVRSGVHLIGITDGMNLSGSVDIPLEIGANQGPVQIVTISANGQDINFTQPLIPPFSTAPPAFHVATEFLSNGVHTLQTSATVLIPQTNAYDSPYLSLTNAPVTVNVYNDISYPNWVMEYTDDLLIVRISTAYLEADWEVPVAGSEIFDHIWTFSGHTSNGQIEFTWDLRDADGNKREDESFYSEVRVYPTGAAGAAPAAPIVGVNPPLIKQFDNYPDEGKWTVARHDYIPHNSQNYNIWVDALNSIARMGEQRGGVLPLPDGTNRNPGEAFVIRTGPTATNSILDWRLWLDRGITNRNVRNLYYFGHGAPNAIGDRFGGIPANVVGQYLGNALNASLGETRYRFVWMDGCNTADGLWPHAFALGRKENKPLSSYSARPGAYCGFSALIYVWGDPLAAVYAAAVAYRSEFVLNWDSRDMTLKEAFDSARVTSGWVDGGYLRIYGYWGLHAGEFNRKSQWPRP